MSTLLRLIELLGTLAFAASGILAARRKAMDFFGVYVVAFVTAFGGGTLRDLLLDRRPIYWVQDSTYALIIFAISVAAVLLRRFRPLQISERMFVVPDALGLGLFSALGVSYALGLGVPAVSATIMGVVTGTFGGVTRDIICNEVPTVFRRSQLYATCALLGAWVYIGVQALAGGEAALIAAIIVTTWLRLLAVRRDWRLPF